MQLHALGWCKKSGRYHTDTGRAIYYHKKKGMFNFARHLFVPSTKGQKGQAILPVVARFFHDLSLL
jgi:hypothetical protein